MREIKFRQPIFDTNGVFEKWHYWGLFDVGGNFEYTPPTERHYLEFSKLTDPLDSQQFTGLHDKNGKEIYEGDIVMFWGGIGKVIYFDAYASFKIQYTENDMADLNLNSHEILGNIYENPELLNQ